MSTAESNSARPRLTVALLVHGEPGNLARALSSARTIADELLVIDCGRSSPVAEIAAQQGARYLEHAWQDSFALARNAGMAAAVGDWALWLEADEFLSVEQARALRSLVDQQTKSDKAWLVYVQAMAQSPQDTPQRAAQLRLLPLGQGVNFEGRVAESARTALDRLGIAVELSQVTLQRDARFNEPAVRRARARRDLKLLDQELPLRGPQPSLLCLLGECHQTLGNPVAAGKYYQQAVRAARPGSPELLEAYYGLLTTIDDAHHETRLAVCLQALEVYPFDAQLLCAMGSYLESQNRVQMACRAYQTAVQVGQIHPETWHLADIGEVAAHCLATMWELQQQDDKARQTLREGLERFPNSVRLRRGLIDLEVRSGRVIDALDHLEKLPADFPSREALRSAVRGACQAARNNWNAATSYLQMAYDAGCRDAICLRWLRMALLSNNRANEADAILREWQRLDPSNLEVRKYVAEAVALHSSAAPLLAKNRQMRVDLPAASPVGSAPAILPGAATAASKSL